jgi:hypothetical protein
MSNRNIIQTPSHLSLFDKTINKNTPIDYRTGIFNTCERNKLEKRFFNITNIKYLLNNINSKIGNEYVLNEEVLTLVMTNMYTTNYNIMNVREMNDKMLTVGVEEIKSLLVSNSIYINDKSNTYTLMDRPQMTSNKIEKQLPKYSFY